MTWTPTDDLQVIETHISRVYLGKDRVWKTKKPVNLGFLDFTTPEARRLACEAEVELNGRLAPGVYLGVVPVQTPGSEERDWAVVMRRLPDDSRADLRLRRGDLSRSDLDRVAERLARFHGAARCDEETSRFGEPQVVRGNVEENFEQTRCLIGNYLTPDQAAEVRHWQLEFLEREAGRFTERAASGRVRDGHGDLRLEHVYLDVPELDGPDSGEVVIVDCIEFNERFRFADVCADVAFLAMDLASRRRPDLAEAFLASYARASQDYDLYPLVDFYQSYRAFVRAKVAAMVAHSGDTPAKLRPRKDAEARQHFLLALSSARRELMAPRLVAVGGWIAAGKSTMSETISQILDAPVIDADRTRKHLLSVEEDEHLYVEAWTGPYDEEMNDRTYGELLRRAELVLRSGRPVVLDASFRLQRHRLDAYSLAEALRVPFLFVECRAEAEVCRERLRKRTDGPSDGRPEIFDDFVAGYEEVTALPNLQLETDRLTPGELEERLLTRLPSTPPEVG